MNTADALPERLAPGHAPATARQVSVVIPCHNMAQWVARAIASAARSDPAEIIVIDDGSTDASRREIERFGDRVIARFLPNAGAPAARNRGLDGTAARYVMFLDADDYLEQGFLAAIVAGANGRGADLAFGRWRFEWPDGRQQGAAGVAHDASDTEDLICSWLEGGFAPPCAVLWRTEFLRGLGGWQTGLRRNQDGELVLRALLSGARWTAVETPDAIYFQHLSPERVSARSGAEVYAGEVAVLSRLLQRAPAASERLRRTFGIAQYRLAREAYRNGAVAEGRLALAEARRLGIRGHPGTIAHRLSSTALGLGRKEALVGWRRTLAPRPGPPC
jgi:glycosyltransferase involved in cell wall biosynthesis